VERGKVLRADIGIDMKYEERNTTIAAVMVLWRGAKAPKGLCGVVYDCDFFSVASFRSEYTVEVPAKQNPAEWMIVRLLFDYNRAAYSCSTPLASSLSAGTDVA
jgi:hypothetical protein